MNPKEDFSEELYLVWHRLGSLIDIWTAYSTFLMKQVEVGSGKVCGNQQIYDNTTNTLLIVYQSYLYSLFDPSGTNFIKATEPSLISLSDKAIEIRNEIILEWREIETPINKIRHKIGFHGGKNLKNHKAGFDGFRDIKLHPWAGEYIFRLMRAFFATLELDRDNLSEKERSTQKENRDEIYNIAKNLKEEMIKNPTVKLINYEMLK
jgi:hypothetical protein